MLYLSAYYFYGTPVCVNWRVSDSWTYSKVFFSFCWDSLGRVCVMVLILSYQVYVVKFTWYLVEACSSLMRCRKGDDPEGKGVRVGKQTMGKL